MNFGNRRYIITAIILAFAFIFALRLLTLQVVSDSYKAKAAELTEEKIRIYPSRGLVYDRNGELLVANRAIYDLMVVPRKTKAFDTLALGELVNMTVDELRVELKKARKYSRHKASVIKKQIDPDIYARISEKLHRYPGFFAQARTVRSYQKGLGAHVLGDYAEAGPSEIEKDHYYRSGDYIGKSGIEMTYEKELRGKKGAKYVLVDVRNNVQESLSEGKYDTSAVAGKDLYITIDAELQAYAELLMSNKMGSIVAIEPATGEILTLVSAPSFDPNLLVGSNRGENFRKLQVDSLKPLYNRATQGLYRPGSIFKMVQSLVALQRGSITKDTRIACNRGIIGCHGSHSFDDLEGAIIHSCNPYFHQVFKRMIEPGETTNRFKDSQIGIGRWNSDIKKFGFGWNLGSDIPGIKEGNVPNQKYYDRIYGELGWAFSTIYSMSIGEGELLINPLQMANLAAIIANRGWYHSPHVIKSIGDEGKPPQFLEKINSGVNEEYFTTVVNAMEKVVGQDGGTARRARIEGITVCGKTGTVQNEPYPDHSVFIAFAPKDNPKIAISVYVEYSGFGGTWAAPIASLLIEKYLNDSISDPSKEERIIEQSFGMPKKK
jgi:penicillin-binding protein 2